MKALLDTCVLSELQKVDGHPLVHKTAKSLPDEDVFISAISMSEIVKGIHLLAEGRRRQQLSEWLMSIDRQYQNRILPADRQVVQIWGEIAARAQKTGIQIPAPDGLIAATAIANGLHVMTRNRRDFAATGAMIIDPWETN